MAINYGATRTFKFINSHFGNVLIFLCFHADIFAAQPVIAFAGVAAHFGMFMQWGGTEFQMRPILS